MYIKNKHLKSICLLASLLMLISGCKQVPMMPGLTAYKIDIQQGNAVTQEMVAKLQPGMTRSQVRFALGTPLLVDPFVPAAPVLPLITIDGVSILLLMFTVLITVLPPIPTPPLTTKVPVVSLPLVVVLLSHWLPNCTLPYVPLIRLPAQIGRAHV